MLRIHRRGIAAFLIIAFWAVMTGSLVYEEVVRPWMGFVPPVRSTSRTMDVWLGVFTDADEQVGYVHTSSFPMMREGEQGARLSMSANLRLNLPALGFTEDVSLGGSAWVLATRGLSDFQLDVESGDRIFHVDGVVADGTLSVTLHVGDEQVTTLRFPVGEYPLLADGLGFSLANMPSLRPGRTAYLDVFNPVAMSTSQAKLTCLRREVIDVSGESVEANVIETELNGMTTTSWVTDTEEVVRVDTPLGFRLRKMTSDEALGKVKALPEAGGESGTAPAPAQ